MSRHTNTERGSNSLGCGLVLGFIAAFIIAWYFQYQICGPIDGRVDNAHWYHGLLHGWFAVPNWLFGLFSDQPRTIFQSGGGGWYQFWYLVGIGAIFGRSSSSNRH